MTRIAPFATALLLAAVRSGAQVPVFPAQTERVVVDVVVSDAHGRPVAGLSRDDFVVEDEGVPQAIEEFEAVDVSVPAAAGAGSDPASRVVTNEPTSAPARAFLIVFDDINLSPASGEHVRRALRKFLELQLRESDCVSVAPAAGGAWWSGCLGSDREDLDAALAAMRGKRQPDLTRERMSDYEAMRIEIDHDREALYHVAERYVQSGLSLTGGSMGRSAQQQADDMEGILPLVRTTAAAVYTQARIRNERTLSALERGMRALTGGRGRRIVILASNGFIHDHRLPGFERVREAARRSNAALYFVDANLADAGLELSARPLPVSPRYQPVARQYSTEESAGAEVLADDTGGFTVRGTDLHPGLARMTAESRVFYLLGYAPSQLGKDGGFRKLKVRVSRPGVKVRARSGYYSGRSASDAVAGSDAPPQQALDALDDARRLSLRMAVYVLGNAGVGRISVLLHAEADISDLQLEPKQGRITGVVQSYSSVAFRDTGELGEKERVHELALRPEDLPRMATTWLPVTHLYELPPGRYQARMLVSDRAGGRTGSVRRTFDVPSAADLRISTPVLTDVLAPAGVPDAAPRPVPVARRSFRIGTRLVCAVEVWGGRAVPERSAVDIVYEVRRADGSIVARTNPKLLARESTGAHPDQFKLTLHRAGEYELRLRARDHASGEEAAAVERFRVGAEDPS